MHFDNDDHKHVNHDNNNKDDYDENCLLFIPFINDSTNDHMMPKNFDQEEELHNISNVVLVWDLNTNEDDDEAVEETEDIGKE